MKKLLLISAMAILLCGCDEHNNNGVQSDGTNYGHFWSTAIPEEKKVDFKTQQEQAIQVAKTEREIDLINAEKNLAVAKIDSQTSLIKAETQIKINVMIQNSVQDKKLLEKWNLGIDGMTWTPVSNVTVGNCLVNTPTGLSEGKCN